MGQGLDNDIETLEPHSNIDDNRKHEKEGDIRAKRLTPESQRSHTVAESHDPEGKRILTKRPKPELRALKGIITEPCDVELSNIGVGNNAARYHDELTHRVKMVGSNQAL